MWGLRLLTAVLLLATVTAGCIGQADHVDREIHIVDGMASADDARGEDEYWMVWIRGNETDERANPFVCSRVPPDYNIDHANASVVYDNRSYGFDPGSVRVLLAFAHEDRSSQCPEAVHLVANPAEPHVETMGEYGDLSIVVRDDGTLLVDGELVPLGKAAEVTYEGTPAGRDKLHVDGSFRVETLGAWSHVHLQAGRP